MLLTVKLIMYTTEAVIVNLKLVFYLLLVRKPRTSEHNALVHCVNGYFGQLKLSFSSLSFSSILGRKLFSEPRYKTPEPYHLFFLPFPTKQSLKMLFLHFSFLNFLSSLDLSKQTHPKTT